MCFKQHVTAMDFIMHRRKFWIFNLGLILGHGWFVYNRSCFWKAQTFASIRLLCHKTTKSLPQRYQSNAWTCYGSDLLVWKPRYEIGLLKYSLFKICRNGIFSGPGRVQRKYHLCIPRKGIAWPQSLFPHSRVCERLFIPMIGPHIFLQ